MSETNATIGRRGVKYCGTVFLVDYKPLLDCKDITNSLELLYYHNGRNKVLTSSEPHPNPDPGECPRHLRYPLQRHRPPRRLRRWHPPLAISSIAVQSEKIDFFKNNYQFASTYQTNIIII